MDRFADFLTNQNQELTPINQNRNITNQLESRIDTHQSNINKTNQSQIIIPSPKVRNTPLPHPLATSWMNELTNK